MRKTKKSFITELARKPKKPAESPRDFSWKQPVADTDEINAMATEYRLKQHSEAKEGESDLTAEHAKHVKKRRKI